MMARLLVGLALAAMLAAPASAQRKPKEICATQAGQFAELRFCVSSAASHLDEKSGADVFTRTDRQRAWCEGATGYGIGENVTIHFKPAVRVQQFALLNGHQASDETFQNNSRVKLLRIQSSDGFATIVTLPDAKEFNIKLPRALKPRWVRFSIVDVYPGARGSDTCIAGILPDLEQFKN